MLLMHSTEGPAGPNRYCRGQMDGKERGRGVEGMHRAFVLRGNFGKFKFWLRPSLDCLLAPRSLANGSALEKLLRVPDATERKVGFLPRLGRSDCRTLGPAPLLSAVGS